MGQYIHSIELDDGSCYKIEPTLFAMASTGNDNTDLIADIDENFELATGVYIFLQVEDVGNQATLNVNDAGEIPIVYNNAPIAEGQLKSDRVYALVYDGAQWQVVGDLALIANENEPGVVKIGYEPEYDGSRTYAVELNNDAQMYVHVPSPEWDEITEKPTTLNFIGVVDETSEQQPENEDPYEPSIPITIVGMSENYIPTPGDVVISSDGQEAFLFAYGNIWLTLFQRHVGLTPNRLCYTISNSRIDSTNHYASDDQIGINTGNSFPYNCDAPLYVNQGVEHSSGIIIAGKENEEDDPSRLLLGYSDIQALKMNSEEVFESAPLFLQRNGGHIQIGSNLAQEETHILYGQYTIKTSHGFCYEGIQPFINAFDVASPIWFSAHPSIALGIPVYDESFIYNAVNKSLQVGDITIIGSASSIESDSFIKAKKDLIITTVIPSQPSASEEGEGSSEEMPTEENQVTNKDIYINSAGSLYFAAAATTDSIANSVILENQSFKPNSSAQISLGTRENRWTALYLGAEATYGDAYTPIYWHDGNPTTIIPVQYCSFTIESGKQGVTLKHNAFNNKSYVLQIVIESGESNLNSAIRWNSGVNTIINEQNEEITEGYINLICDIPPAGNVSGYLLVSRGEFVDASATAIEPST